MARRALQAVGGLLEGFVVLDETAGERPATVARAVVQADEEHAAVTLDDGVRSDLHEHELGEAADRAGRPVASVDAGAHERRRVAGAERKAKLPGLGHDGRGTGP